MDLEKRVVSNIKRMRSELGLTQGEVAERLEMSRPTYIAIEKGERDLTLRELERIAEILQTDASILYTEDPRDDRKFEQMLLYFVQKYPEGIPKTKLAKLLYIADFYSYYNEMAPMSGVQYVKQKYGPVADIFFQLLDELYDCHALHIEPVGNALVVTPAGEVVSEDLLSEKDKEIMDKIDNYWHDKNTQEIVNFTHEQHPWMTSFDKEKIPYYSIVQEDSDHVYAPGLE